MHSLTLPRVTFLVLCLSTGLPSCSPTAKLGSGAINTVTSAPGDAASRSAPLTGLHSIGTADRIVEEPVHEEPVPPPVLTALNQLDSTLTGFHNLFEQDTSPLDPTPPRTDHDASKTTPPLADILFAFDRWTIPASSRPTLLANAEWLTTHPQYPVILEGHCDERGTLAYNLLLGEKRAKSVQAYLHDLGLAPDRMTITSFGAERPRCRDFTESCFQQNRRVHFTSTLP